MPDEMLPAVPDDSDDEPVYDLKVVEPTAVVTPGRVVAVPRYTRAAVRHGAYIGFGAVVLVRRWHHRRTRHERTMRALEAQGNHEAMLAHRQQHELERQNRAERRVKLLHEFIELVRVSPVIGAIALILMAVTGLAMAVVHRHPADFLWPWMTLFRAIALAVTVASVAWLVISITAAVALVAVLHRLGRTGEALPRWAAVSADPGIDAVIDERAVTKALVDLRIPQLVNYVQKQGLPLHYIVPCRQEGRGTYFEVRLPDGLPAEEIAKPARRVRLAAGLYRHTKEVWPSVGGDASHLKGWIADKGALDEGAGPYPLLDEGFTDVFKGLPFGKTLRGDPTRIPVIGRNTLCGGAPEQGKSNGARVVAVGYTLDIITELRIYVPDTNFDFERFAPRTARYVMGAEDEHIEQIVGELESLKDELQVRGQKLVDMEQEEVTHALAHAGIGLHPLFVLVEEAHIVIQHQKFGKDASQLLCDIVKLDRKRGVHLMLSTQAPTKDSMPRDVTRNCTNGIAYAVGDHVANDALLGQGAYRAGHRATDLIPGADRGTALCKGFSSEARSELVQAYRVSGRSGDDQVSPIVARAMAALERKGRAVPGSGRPLAITARDLLTDLGEVLRGDSEPVRLSDLPPLLSNYARAWAPYKTLTGMRLRELLKAEGVRTTNTGNVPRLDPEDLRRVLAERGELVERDVPNVPPGRGRRGVA